VKFKKAIIVEAIAKSVQEHSYYKQREYQKTQQQRKNPYMNTLGQVFGPASSLNASGGTSPVLRRTERFTFVRGNFTRIGASQPTIAGWLNRHERTARRRLSKTYRAKLQERVGEGLASLNRAQIVVQTNIAPEAFRFEQAQTPFDTFRGFEAYGRVWRI
jgi:hypothetical protein